MGGGSKKAKKTAGIAAAVPAASGGAGVSPSGAGGALQKLHASVQAFYDGGADFASLTAAFGSAAAELKGDPAAAQEILESYAKAGITAFLEGKAVPEEVAAGAQEVAQALGVDAGGLLGSLYSKVGEEVRPGLGETAQQEEAWTGLASLATLSAAAEEAAQPPWLREVSPLDSGFWSDVRDAGALGKPFMVAGPDVEDQTFTAVFCHDPAAPDDPGKNRLVLFGKLRPEAEAKLMDALAVDEKASPGPLASDVFWGEILTAAKSVNHHVGEGSPIPQHTQEKIKAVKAALASFAPSSPQEQKMKETYEQYITVLEHAAEKGEKTYKLYSGGMFSQFVPSLEESERETAGGFKAKKITGSRPFSEEKEGQLFWDGEKRIRDKIFGEEYEIDLGDGYRLIYHPSRNPVPYSLRGTVELIGPPGSADGHTALEKLSLLHLHASPVASAEEAEVMYLERNVWVQGFGDDPEYKKIGKTVSEIGRKYEAEAVARLEEAAAHLSEEEMIVLAKSLVLENQRRLLRHRAKLLKNFFEKKLGLAEGSLDNFPAYQPRPLAASGKKGGHFWNRFDLTADKVRQALKGYVIAHKLGENETDRLCRLIESGGFLACGEVRARMGIRVSTTSPVEDMKTGGASYAFTFIRPAFSQRDYDIVWEPETLLTRSDWFATKDDAFGAVNPADPKSGYEKTTNVKKLKSWKSHFSGWGGQVMFKNGIDLFGIHPPRHIFVKSAADREKVLASFAKVGVKELGGRPVEEVVQVR